MTRSNCGEQLVPVEEVRGSSVRPRSFGDTDRFPDDVVMFWDGRRTALTVAVGAKVTAEIKAEQERIRQADLAREAELRQSVED
jgi:hypothetical protein